jgi:hypothetical protein
LTLALVGAVTLGAGSVAYANTCAFDAVPAATLLFPFVSYNYDEGTEGTTTIFSITNTSYEAQIVHVTVWTDFSVAILDFNILLTGYDVLRYNIRDILDRGFLPVTLNEPHEDPRVEYAIERGPISGVNQYAATDPPDLPDPLATNTLGGRCPTSSPSYPGLYANPIPQQIRALFQGWLQSSQSLPRYHQNCDDEDEYVPTPEPWFEARTTADDTWLYMTMDVVQTCNTLFPDDFGYFVDEIRYDNVLVGDVAWVDNVDRFSEVDQAVHLEADFAIDYYSTVNERGYPTTFYSRYANPDGFVDYREPLPTAWAMRYQENEIIGLETYIRAWKGGTFYKIVPDLYLEDEDESPEEMWAYNCVAYTYYAWDEDENGGATDVPPWSQPGGEAIIINQIPLETQEVRSTQFNIIDQYGWFLFVWPASNWTFVGSPPYTPFDASPPLRPWADQYQTWMGAKYVKTGDYSGALTGQVMANFNCFGDQVLPGLGWNDSFMIDPWGP